MKFFLVNEIIELVITKLGRLLFLYSFFLFFSFLDFCSHRRSWKYYAVSLIDESSFTAIKCSSYREFLAGKCNGNLEVPMGFATPTNTLVNRISNFLEVTKCFNHYLEKQIEPKLLQFFYATITIHNYNYRL